MVGRMRRRSTRTAMWAPLFVAAMVAANSCGNSILGSIKSVDVQYKATLIAPVVPVAPTLTVGDSQLTVTISAVVGSTSYDIYWSTANDTGSIPGANVKNSTALTTAITGLTNGVAYYVWIKAENSHGMSAFSQGASLTPTGGILAQVQAPTFSSPGTTYSSDQSILLYDTTAGAKIYYTTNGTIPSAASTEFTSTPIAINGDGTSMTIKAIAIKSGLSDSPVVTSVYSINYLQVATPVISPAASTYNISQTITMTDATSGSSIYYTTEIGRAHV